MLEQEAKMDTDEELSNEEIIKKYYNEFLEVFNEKVANVLPEHRPYDCKIELEPDASLHKGYIYPVNPKEEEALKEFIRDNLAKGFIRKSVSPARHPVLFVPKKTGGLRLCNDYRPLNKVTKRNAFPLPLINQVLEAISGMSFFTKLDLKSAYNLVRIREGDEYKTAFSTKFGHYEYLVMPFGLTNAPATFQAFMNDVLHEEINVCCQVYLDDIIIYSKTFDLHIKHVRLVLSQLKAHKLVAKLEKCEFHRTEVAFLGHVVCREGIKTDPTKIAAVAEWPKPKNVKQLQSFLGFCNYYRRFIPNFARVAKPLYVMTSKKSQFIWNEERSDAFEKLKELLTSPPVLSYPNYDKQFIVECDASNYAIGGVLSQINDKGELHPVYYYSKTLSKAEVNYSITEKELLAIKVAFQEWRHLLMGAKHQVLVYSDHKNLLFASKPQLLSARQARWQEFFAGYDFKIIYRPGKSNGRADSLSRNVDLENTKKDLDKNSIINPENLIDFPTCDSDCFVATDTGFVSEIKQAYHSDDLASTILHDVLEVQGNNDNKKKWVVIDGLIIRKKRPEQVYIPFELRKMVMRLCHDSESAGHLGIEKTLDLVARNYFWPKMAKDVEGYVKACSICNCKKDSTHAPFGTAVRAPILDLPWQEIQIDFITDLPIKVRNSTSSVEGNSQEEVRRAGCIMVTSDKLTKFIHLSGFRHLPSAAETAKSFLRDIFRLHGCPKEITTDRGTQFTSNLWKDILKLLGCRLNNATTNHHQTVGQVERNNAYVETYLRCFVATFDDDSWMNYLYLAEFCYNNAIHASTKQSPFIALYNYQICATPQTAELQHSLGAANMIDSFAHNLANLKHILEIQRTRFLDQMDKHRSTNYPTIKLYDLVWLKKPANYNPLPFYKLQTRKYGPFRVVGIDESKKNYRLDINESPFPNMYPVFHISEIEPYYRSPKSLEPEPFGSKKIIKILDSKKEGHFYKYLVTRADNSQEWISADEIDHNDHYNQVLKEFQNRLYHQFVASVANSD